MLATMGLGLLCSGCEAFWIYFAMDTIRGEEATIAATPDAGGGAGGAVLDVTVAGVGGSDGAGGAPSSTSGGTGGDTSTTSTTSTGCVPHSCEPQQCGVALDADGCGGPLDCGDCAGGPLVYCGSGNTGQVCLCTKPPLANEDIGDIQHWCDVHGGGVPRYCGNAPPESVPNCKDMGYWAGVTASKLFCCKNP